MVMTYFQGRKFQMVAPVYFMESTISPNSWKYGFPITSCLSWLIKYLLSCHTVLLFTGEFNEGMHAVSNYETRSDACWVLHIYSIVKGIFIFSYTCNIMNEWYSHPFCDRTGCSHLWYHDWQSHPLCGWTGGLFIIWVTALLLDHRGTQPQDFDLE